MSWKVFLCIVWSRFSKQCVELIMFQCKVCCVSIEYNMVTAQCDEKRFYDWLYCLLWGVEVRVCRYSKFNCTGKTSLSEFTVYVLWHVFLYNSQNTIYFNIRVLMCQILGSLYYIVYERWLVFVHPLCRLLWSVHYMSNGASLI